MKKGFLLRVSANNDSCVTLSRKTKEGCKHKRIVKQPDGFSIQIGNNVHTFSTLVDFLSSTHAKERTKKGGLHLTKVCNKDSPFAAVHHHMLASTAADYESSPLLQMTRSVEDMGLN